MRRVFTRTAIAECLHRGHAFAWRRSCGNLGFEECTRCGHSGPLQERQRSTVHQRIVDIQHRDNATSPRATTRGPQTQWTDHLTGAVVTRAERDAEIVRQTLEEGSQRIAIAERWGITPQRVGQIVHPPARRRRHEGTL